MPIHEFRCLECNEIFELLMIKEEDRLEMKCPRCGSENFERVLSTTNYAVGFGAGKSRRPSVQTRECASGTCSTMTLPGHTKN